MDVQKLRHDEPALTLLHSRHATRYPHICMFSETRTTHKKNKTNKNTTMQQEESVTFPQVLNVESKVIRISVVNFMLYTVIAGRNKPATEVLFRNVKSYTGHNEYFMSFITDLDQDNPPPYIEIVVTTTTTTFGWAPNVEKLYKAVMRQLEELSKN